MSESRYDDVEATGWAQLFSTLANVEDWSEMSPGRILVMEETVAALLPGRELTTVELGPVGRFNVDLRWVWQLTRALVADLVDRQRVVLPFDKLSDRPLVVGEQIELRQVEDLVLFRLALLLMGLGPGFLRCANCKLVAPRGRKPNQQYCGPTCRSRAADAKRRGEPRKVKRAA